MLHSSYEKGDNSPNDNERAFCEKGIIDVTDFRVMSPEQPIGYLCGCQIILLQNGFIEVHTVEDEYELLERFHVLSIRKAIRDMNNHDPKYSTWISLITDSKAYRLSFQPNELKAVFWTLLIETYDKVKMTSPNILEKNDEVLDFEDTAHKIRDLGYETYDLS